MRYVVIVRWLVKDIVWNTIIEQFDDEVSALGFAESHRKNDRIKSNGSKITVDLYELKKSWTGDVCLQRF